MKSGKAKRRIEIVSGFDFDEGSKSRRKAMLCPVVAGDEEQKQGVAARRKRRGENVDGGFASMI